jgi:hypothetical protein
MASRSLRKETELPWEERAAVSRHGPEGGLPSPDPGPESQEPSPKFEDVRKSSPVKVMVKKSKPVHGISVPNQLIERRIHRVRDQKVMLDEDLAELYRVPTSRLNEQVTRNLDRFPQDFMFRLTHEEALALRSQNAILKSGRGQHRKYLPRAFTEHGVLMLSSVLHSERAIQVNIAIMRAFVRLRELATSHAELTRKLNALEVKYDVQFKVVFDAIRALTEPYLKPRRRIGFKPDDEL